MLQNIKKKDRGMYIPINLYQQSEACSILVKLGLIEQSSLSTIPKKIEMTVCTHFKMTMV